MKSKTFLALIRFRRKYRIVIYICAVLILSFYLRTFNINWDDGYYFHPDERAIIMFAVPLSFPVSISQFLTPESPLNPHFFAYGTLPLYLVRILGEIFSVINPLFREYAGMYMIGRIVSALADTGTVFLVFLIAANLFSKRTGLFAAFLYACSVFPIQASHFYAVDSLLTFFTTAVVLLLLKISNYHQLRYYLLLGAALGLALSTKVSSAIFVILLLITFSYIFYRFKSQRVKTLFYSSLTFFTALFLFIATQPYALIDFVSFIEQVNLQSQMSKNAFIFPYTLQYVGKIPYLYELKNILLWGQGPFIFCLEVVGFIILLIHFFKKSKMHNFPVFLIFFTLLFYFLVFGKFAVGWMRYMLPIYPLLSIFGGYFISNVLVGLIPAEVKSKFYLQKALLFLFCALILLYPVSFLSIYLEPNTRLQASEWMHKNIAPGSTIAVEHWDDSLPVTQNDRYAHLTLPLYEPDTIEKWKAINQTLKNADYIAIASNRLYAPLQRLTDCDRLPPDKCYLKTSNYYKLLFSEKLGFKKVAEFSEYPTVPFLNIELPDDDADESFTVYDHPKVIIFKRMND